MSAETEPFAHEPRWRPACQAPALAADEVHVWNLPLEATRDRLDRHWPLLSAEEQQQAARFVRPELTRRFIMRRALLRLILADYCGDPGQPLAFRWNNFGKPYLDGPRRAAGIQFNSSQSHEVALLAVARDHEIGVDVERLRLLADFEQLSRRFFADDEARHIAEREPRRKLPAFFWIWTGKEAILKACGIGIATGLRRAGIELDRDGPRLAFLDADLGDAENWRLTAFLPRADYVATLAARAAAPRLRFLTWNR